MVRTLLVRLLSRFLPPTGRRRATSVPRSLPAPVAPSVVAAPSVPLRVRPYYAAWEIQCEQLRQRERRVALLLATYGLDFVGVAA